MGILDFFKRKNKDKVESVPEEQFEQPKSEPLVISYDNGIEAKVNFKGIIIFDDVALEEAFILYGKTGKDDNTFIGKRVFLEPHAGKDSNGKPAYDTAEYYKSLWQSDKQGAVEGFFQKEQVDARETNYLGILDFTPDGKSIRREDKIFAAYYKDVYKSLQESEKKIQINAENEFKKAMEDKVNNLPDTIDNTDATAQILNPELLKDREKNDEDGNEI